MRWQTFMTIGMSCSTKRMVTPDAPIFCTNSMNRAVSDGFHSRHRFVQEQHRWLHRECQRDAEQPLLAVGQGPGQLGGPMLKPDEAQDVVSEIAELLLGSLLAGCPQQRVPQRGPAAAMETRQHVLEDARVLKHAGALKSPDETEPGDLVGLQSFKLVER